MEIREKEFEMVQIGGREKLKVREQILFCPSCKNYFITQDMSRLLVLSHPGYYVDVSVYDLKPSKKARTTAVDNPQKNQPKEHKEVKTSTNSPITQPTTENKPTSQEHSSISSRTRSGINAKVYLSNTYSAANNICPVCSSVLTSELVNIPVIEQNGDFYRYYTDRVRYCYKCRRAYISKDNVASILSKVNGTSAILKTLRLENATVHTASNSRDFLYRPTLDNSHAIFYPAEDYRFHSSNSSGEMELNAQSFLGEMGYSVNKGVNIRRHILAEAIKKHGKRRVSDHLAFLISTRKAQLNGEAKYANALRIWQDDLNYISNF